TRIIFFGVPLNGSGPRACFQGQPPTHHHNIRAITTQQNSRRLCRGARILCQDKMFQLWGLVLLCGLLAGTSASLLDNDVVRELQSALKKGLETDDSAFECESASGMIREEPSNGCMRNDKGELWFLHRLTIRSISIGNITFQGTPGGTGINLSISITAEVTLTLPLLGAVVDLTLNFVLQTSISFKIDESGTLMVVMGECTYTPAKISLPFVNSSISSPTGLISNIRKTVTTLVKLVEDYIVQYVLCPRIHTIISSLNENLVKNLNDWFLGRD
ncbi:hypothetical protein Celaphus_00007882, partial [Cervus elaphus hippelaphus]